MGNQGHPANRQIGSGASSERRPFKWVRWVVAGVASVALAVGLAACGGDGAAEHRSATAVQEAVGGGEGSGEHGAGGEASGGSESGGSEESGSQLSLNDTFDQVRSGARLVLAYDPATNAFVGVVENVTTNILDSVRIEVHLSNGVELGPTTPMDLAPGQAADVVLPATGTPFDRWSPHAEVGQSGAEGSGEHGAGGEGSGESGMGEAPEGTPEAGGENEAAMSSAITPLDRTWNGTLGGLSVSARYDTAAQTIHTTVQNMRQQVLCYVQAEPHLKLGSRTVGELGPDLMGHLSPGQSATSALAVAGEPSLAGVAFDGYVVHMEVFDCGGTGPVPHTGGEAAEGGSGEGPEDSEGSGGSEGGNEESGNRLALTDIYDEVRAGARLVVGYDPGANAFVGAVENVTNNVLTRVRVEVHLSNGVELGPTTPVDLRPGETAYVYLPATATPFDGWSPHAEVGPSGAEGGGEHGSGSDGSEGSEGGGEGREGAGEHGSSEGSGEHGGGEGTRS